MISSTIIGFINNAALLISLVLMYDIFAIKGSEEKFVLGKILLGIVLGCIGAAIMMTPWEFLPGIVFDTRSVLLCVTGFFFGTVPTLIAVMICSVYRFVIGGSGVWTGVAVIISSGVIGLVWRYWLKKGFENTSTGNLYALGVVTHVVMLLWMLTLPNPDAFNVLSKISVPVLLIYPLCTVLIGKLIVNRLRRIEKTFALEESEKKLRESEAKYRHLFESMTQGVVIQDAEGRIIETNLAACETMGLTMDQMLGKTASDPRWGLIHKDGSPYNPVEMPSNIALRTGKPSKNVHCGIYVPEKDEYRWILIGSVPRFKDGETKPFSTMTVFTDISAQTLAEKNLIQTEKRYRSLFENMTAGFVLFEVVEDKNGAPVDLVIVAANKGFETATGLKIQDVIDKRLSRVLPGLENDSKDWIATYGEIALTGTPQQFEQGSELLGSYYSITAYQAEPKQCAVTFTDITEHKKTEKERENLQAQLLQVQKMEAVGNLAGGVAHDFNNMLSVILGYTELALESTELPGSVHADLEEVLSAARRSTDITRQLLAFARKQTIDPKVLNLNDTIEVMLKMIRRLIGEDIDLSWLPDGDLWSVNIDPSQLDQILVNLCVNARDAIDDVGKVTIETENISLDEKYCSEHIGFTPGNFVLLAVSDDGCGMTKETIEKIFEPFFTTKRLGQGTGMGLSTIFGIVKQNDGFINVYSEIAVGTTFKIYLPRYEGESEETVTKAGTENQLARGETVLVVEDEDSILQLCKRMLTELGYCVLTANTPEEAINMVGTHDKEIHLLLTDVVMPKMNGRDLAEHLQSVYPAIKTLFMSGYTANVIAHHGVLEKGIHFVPKPLSRQVLAAKVREALEDNKTCNE